MRNKLSTKADDAKRLGLTLEPEATAPEPPETPDTTEARLGISTPIPAPQRTRTQEPRSPSGDGSA